MLRAGSDAGIKGIHAGMDEAAPARAPRLIDAVQRAEPSPETLVLVVQYSTERGSAPRIEPEGTDVPVVPVVSPSGAGVSPRRPRHLLDIQVRGSTGPEALPARSSLETAARHGGFEAWGLGFDEVPPLPTLVRAVELGPGWIRLPFHLLSPPSTDEAITVARTAGIPIVASNPFADGRLDGSQLRGSPLETIGRPAPSDWAAVRRTWAPVLALGFLTESHQRSLAQAALQYVLGVEGVAATLVPAGEPDALKEAADALHRPSLTPAERARIGRVRSGAPASTAVAHASELK
jgi:Aldo/keto reductase family